MTYLTISQIHALHGWPIGSLKTKACKLRKRLGTFGRKIGPRNYEYSPDEVEKLRPQRSNDNV